VNSLGADRVSGMHAKLSKEWITGSVGGYGDSKHKLQKSLRKKIYEHSESRGHTEAKSIKEKAAKDQLKNILVDQQSANFVATPHIFRTAYYIAKSDRPFTDHPDLIDLQKLNGVKVGRVLHSNVTCVDIVEHIASDMRCKIVKCIVDGKVPLSMKVLVLARSLVL